MIKFKQFWISNKKWVFLSLFLSILQPLCFIPIGLIVKGIFDNILNNSKSTIYFDGLFAVLILILINTAIIIFGKYISLKLVKRFISELRELLIVKLIYSTFIVNTDENVDFIHSNITFDTDRVDNFLASLLTQFLPSIFITAGLFTYLIYLNSLLLGLYSIIIPLLFIILKLHRNTMNKLIIRYHEEYSKFSSGVLFVLKYFDLIKVSSSEKYESSRQLSLIKNVENSSKNVAWVQTFKSIISENIFFLGGISILLFGAYQVNMNITSSGSIISFYITLNVLLPYLKNLTGFFHTFLDGMNSIKSILKIIDYPNLEINSSTRTEFKKNIKLETISFSIAGSKIFENINFEFIKHQMYFITGESGAGKTTLMRLLMGFYPLQEGRILIDGENIDSSTLLAFRKKVGFLAQEPLFFKGTIHENLIYGLDIVTQIQIEDVCKHCLIHEFIQSLPDGYDTEIGNNGMKLSGGQKQKIAIARTLLRAPDLLILDEPDKNLNEESIFKIIQYLRNIRQTTIIITHNHSIIKNIEIGLTI